MPIAERRRRGSGSHRGHSRALPTTQQVQSRVQLGTSGGSCCLAIPVPLIAAHGGSYYAQTDRGAIATLAEEWSQAHSFDPRMVRVTSSSSGRGKRSAGKTATPIVQSAARAVRLLQAVFYSSEGRRLSELSRELGLHRATALRLLRTLEAEGVVSQDPRTKLYRPNPSALLVVASLFGRLRAVTSGAQDLLESLADTCSGTSMLASPLEGGRDMILVMHSLPKHGLMVKPTDRAPMHAVGTGKCYLASLPEDELEEWVRGGLPKITKQTITSPKRLIAKLAQVRTQGYVAQSGEFLEGSCSLAVPVLDEGGSFMAALELTVPETQMTEVALVRQCLQPLREAAARLSRDVLADLSHLGPRRDVSRNASPAARQAG